MLSPTLSLQSRWRDVALMLKFVRSMLAAYTSCQLTSSMIHCPQELGRASQFASGSASGPRARSPSRLSGLQFGFKIRRSLLLYHFNGRREASGNLAAQFAREHERCGRPQPRSATPFTGGRSGDRWRADAPPLQVDALLVRRHGPSLQRRKALPGACSGPGASKAAAYATCETWKIGRGADTLHAASEGGGMTPAQNGKQMVFGDRRWRMMLQKSPNPACTLPRTAGVGGNPSLVWPVRVYILIRRARHSFLLTPTIVALFPRKPWTPLPPSRSFLSSTPFPPPAFRRRRRSVPPSGLPSPFLLTPPGPGLSTPLAV